MHLFQLFFPAVLTPPYATVCHTPPESPKMLQKHCHQSQICFHRVQTSILGAEKVWWGQVWQVRWMRQNSEASICCCRHCNLQCVGCNIVVHQADTFSELPSSLSLDIFTQLAELTGIIGCSYNVTLLLVVNHYYTLRVPEHWCRHFSTGWHGFKILGGGYLGCFQQMLWDFVSESK